MVFFLTTQGGGNKKKPIVIHFPRHIVLGRTRDDFALIEQRQRARGLAATPTVRIRARRGHAGHIQTPFGCGKTVDLVRRGAGCGLVLTPGQGNDILFWASFFCWC